MIEGDPKHDSAGRISEKQREIIVELTRGYIMSFFQREESRKRALEKLEDRNFMEEVFSTYEDFLESGVRMNLEDIARSFLNLIEIEIGESAETEVGAEKTKNKGIHIPLKKPWMKHDH
jgi:hypothetical protein